MLRLKKALVESFVGAIAVGWVFAQGVLHFAYIFSVPIVSWVTRREYNGIINRPISPGFSIQDALPELVRSVSLLVLAYILLRWLYFKPLEEETADPVSEAGA
ncbi:MAG TPA: hypothetical protein VFK81_15625 [Terriglobales bacterium]|jgi:hypothetical protein|nr:hypothetical protein [Terriglobales bacterium]